MNNRREMRKSLKYNHLLANTARGVLWPGDQRDALVSWPEHRKIWLLLGQRTLLHLSTHQTPQAIIDGIASSNHTAPARPLSRQMKRLERLS